jgi:endoglucanase
VYRPENQTIYIANSLGPQNGGFIADFSFGFGDPGDKPFVGDFDGNGPDEIGLHRESTGLVYYRLTLTTGNADNQFIFGDPGDRIIAADWNGDGADSPGLFRPSDKNIYLRFVNATGNADVNLLFPGATKFYLPVAGYVG